MKEKGYEDWRKEASRYGHVIAECEVQLFLVGETGKRYVCVRGDNGAYNDFSELYLRIDMSEYKRMSSDGAVIPGP